MFKLFALVLTLVAGAAHADSDLHTDLPLLYLEQTQGDARNQPLVIFLHGFGSNEEDLFRHQGCAAVHLDLPVGARADAGGCPRVPLVHQDTG